MIQKNRNMFFENVKVQADVKQFVDLANNFIRFEKMNK